MDIEAAIMEAGRRAKAAARIVAGAGSGVKDRALMETASAIEAQRSEIMAANERDLEAGRAAGLSEALLDRLALNEGRLQSMADGLRQVAGLPDPVGEISELKSRPSGIQVGRMRVPLGVIGIIYESRPNVTADAAALCLKAGNAALLRGGSEAVDSNQAIGRCVRDGLQAAGLPPETVQVLETTDRVAVGVMARMAGLVDLIIPRGGRGLIEHVIAEARVPVLKHLDGNCHVYVDDRADPEMAIRVAMNAKTQRYGTCNTMETLLVARGIAGTILPDLGRLFGDAGVELRGCEVTREWLPGITAASETDWDTEYLAPILAVRVVDDLDAAVEHIAAHGSGHTEAIVTDDYRRARRFLRDVDSSSVMVNASTRFADGFEYGLGAEIGISTDKLHARGPVGLEGLTTQKYIVLGDGEVRG